MKRHDFIVFDATESVRSKDENGFLRVASSYLTKETVDPYYGVIYPSGKNSVLTQTASITATVTGKS